jgi:hypothetical protein
MCFDPFKKQSSCILLCYTMYAAVWNALVFRASEKERLKVF